MQKYGQMDNDEREYIIREIENMRQCVHPHLVRFRESFRTEHHLCIIMDLCDGGDRERVDDQSCNFCILVDQQRIEYGVLALV